MEHDPSWLMAALGAASEDTLHWFGQQAKVGHLIMVAVIATIGIASVIFAQAERLTRLEDRMSASEDRGRLYRDRLDILEKKQQLSEVNDARREAKMDSEHKAIMDTLANLPRASANVTVRR